MNENNRYYLNIEQIQRYLPHRHPFLLIDRILEIHPQGNLLDPLTSEDKVGTRVVALKNISVNEPYFQGHFPAYPIVPGVLVIEAMAQAASFSLYPALEKDIDRFAREFKCILVGVDSARFRKPIIPGDSLKIISQVTKTRGQLWNFQVVAEVDSQKVAEAEIMAKLMFKE
ncbi:MAG: 3-hydroxyacyl-ACP dehydratase FabZ [Deltaproteobacteria bacterium]|nr:3-hydroxyacyl-ACP dehydratase FabZ [Deltaproteobacteria bacterium]